MKTQEIKIKLDCGHFPSPHGEHTTGYGIMPDGRKICWGCCAERDATQMRETGRIALYLSKDNSSNWQVSNWPGTLKFSARIRKGAHNIAGSRYDAWFTGHDGRKWHGVQYGENTQICHCRRISN